MPRPQQWGDDDVLEFVTLKAAGQSFCIEITQIREIRRWTPVTALPHAEEAVLGVMNLRGAVIPIIDLAARLGLGECEASPRHVIIVVAIGSKTIGLLVDSVSEILTVEGSQICEAPTMGGGDIPNSILGLISIEEGMSRILAPEILVPRGLTDAA
ncbi:MULTISPECIES: chemotaxis protein CheW [Rhodovulum]|uniref:Purine-binding chemotaxis protein CheW n=2 Tax=Rhodovulum TaxID=34008 RepID=A0A8E2VLX6_9RHOB|nr:MULTISPECIES: chemotaxis protein CheW [Rhodovulum]PTW51416.1 purine-binding chemotaxis protein CheW [Rhodovulum kholense]RAP42941.1 chemotaxis protein CheW [Rhodovulum viride]